MTALFCTSLFPPITYMAEMLRYDAITIEAKETFPKQTYRNRMDIATSQGRRTLTVPVIRNNHSCTDQVLIDYSTPWPIGHLRTLDAAYSASPYYMYYRDDVESLLTTKYSRLVELNQSALVWLSKRLKKPLSVSFTEEWIPPKDIPAYDHRYTIPSKQNPIPYPIAEYYQVFSDRLPFLANLSVLDLMFNIGPEALSYLSSCQKESRED